eukprot:1158085-Pyramimonas_sp.AAC.1
MFAREPSDVQTGARCLDRGNSRTKERVRYLHLLLLQRLRCGHRRRRQLSVHPPAKALPTCYQK